MSIQKIIEQAIRDAIAVEIETEVRADFAIPSHTIGKTCMIRTYSAGVHYGVVASKHETTVLLKDARRVWSWEGAFTLSELSQDGADSGRISRPVPYIELTQAIEIIPMSDSAIKTLDEIHE